MERVKLTLGLFFEKIPINHAALLPLRLIGFLGNYEAQAHNLVGVD